MRGIGENDCMIVRETFCYSYLSVIEFDLHSPVLNWANLIIGLDPKGEQNLLSFKVWDKGVVDRHLS